MYTNYDFELAQAEVDALRAQAKRDVRQYGEVSVNTEIALRRALAALSAAKQAS